MTARSRVAGGGALALVACALLGVAPSRPARAEAFRFPQPIVRTLANGLRVAVFPDPRLELVQVQLLVPAGVIAEPPDKPGVAALAAEMLMRGTTSRNGPQYAAALERAGMRLSTAATRDYAILSAAFLSDRLEGAIELLSDAVMYPTFDPLELRSAKLQVLRSLDQVERNTTLAADARLWAAAWPGHAYGRSTFGDPAFVAQVDVATVRSFYFERYRPAGAVLTIAGNVEPDRAMRTAEEWLGRWERAAADPIPAAAPAPATRTRVVLVDRPGSRVDLRIGAPSPARGAADDLAVTGAATLFGGSPASLPAGVQALFGREVRAKSVSLREGGVFQVSVSVPADSAGAAVRTLLDDLRALQQPPGRESMAEAQRVMRNGAMLSIESAGAIAAAWGLASYYGQPDDFFDRFLAQIDALTPEATAAAAARWLDPGRILVVAVGPAAKVRGQLEPFGTVEEVPAPSAARSAAASAPGPQARPEPRREPTAAERAEGKSLIRKALAAHGGLARLRGVRESRLDAQITLNVMGQKLEGAISQFRKEPDRLLYVTQIGGMLTRQILSGDSAWQATGDENAEMLPADSLETRVLREVYASDLPHVLLEAAAPNVRPYARGREQWDEAVDARVVVFENAAGFEVALFLDPKTGRVLGLEQAGNHAGELTARRRFSDYRAVQGVLWPYYEERLINGEPVMQMYVRNAILNGGLEDSLFMPRTSSSR